MRAPLSPKAIRTFARLTPLQQANALYFIASFARVKPSSLMSTDAQRLAHREMTANAKAREKASAARVEARRQIIVRLDDLRARVNRRRAGTWGTVEMTTAESCKREQLYAELNRLDGIE